MDIRAAIPADLPAINDIFNHYVRTSPAVYLEEPWSAAARAAWFAEHDAAHPALVAEADGRVVAWGSLSVYNGRCGYRFTVEDSVYVASDWRGQGVGRVVLDALIDAARRLGHHTILGIIDAEQQASLALHLRAGFVPVGHLKQVGYKFDRWRDCVFTQKLL